MRTVLAWIMFGILLRPTTIPNVAVDELDSVVVRVVNFNTPSTLMVVKGLVFTSWMVLLIFIAAVWRDRVDGFSIEFAKSVEDIMSGRRSNYMPRIEGFVARNLRDKENGSIQEGNIAIV